MRRPRFVPRVVFASALAGVTPACHETKYHPPEVIVLAVQGFAGSPATPPSSAAPSATGTAPVAPSSTAPVPSSSARVPPPPEPQIIVLAVQGFKGKGP